MADRAARQSRNVTLAGDDFLHLLRADTFRLGFRLCCCGRHSFLKEVIILGFLANVFVQG